MRREGTRRGRKRREKRGKKEEERGGIRGKGEKEKAGVASPPGPPHSRLPARSRFVPGPFPNAAPAQPRARPEALTRHDPGGGAPEVTSHSAQMLLGNAAYPAPGFGLPKSRRFPLGNADE